MTEDEMNERQRRGEYVPPMKAASADHIPDASKMVGEDLVEVAARHIHAFLYGYESANPSGRPDDEDRHIAGIVLAAVTPLIAAQAREDADEYGWLIEHEDEPKWLTLEPGEASYEVCWTTTASEALRFCRRVDAENYVSAHFGGEGPFRITDHIWHAIRAQAVLTAEAEARVQSGIVAMMRRRIDYLRRNELYPAYGLNSQVEALENMIPKVERGEWKKP